MAEQHEISKLLIDKISYGFQFKDNTIRGIDMTERNLSVVTMAQLYEELRRRKYPVTPEATVAYIEGLEDRIADLECVRNTLTQTVSAVLAERDDAKARVAELENRYGTYSIHSDNLLKEAKDAAEHERMLRDMAETRAKELEECIRCGQEKLTKQQVRAMAAETRAKELGAKIRQLCGDQIIPCAPGQSIPLSKCAMSGKFLPKASAQTFDAVEEEIAERHSPERSAAVEPCTAYTGYGNLAAASGPQNSSKGLHRAMGAPDIAGPAAWVEDEA